MYILPSLVRAPATTFHFLSSAAVSVPSATGLSTSFAEMSAAKGLEAWAAMIAGMRSFYGSTKMVANSRVKGLS